MTDDQKWILGLGVVILLAIGGTSAGMTWHFNSRIDRIDNRLDSHVKSINENLKDLAIKVETNSVNMRNIEIRVGNLEADVRNLDAEIERFGQGHEKLVGYVEGRTADGARGPWRGPGGAAIDADVGAFILSDLLARQALAAFRTRRLTAAGSVLGLDDIRAIALEQGWAVALEPGVAAGVARGWFERADADALRLTEKGAVQL